MLDYGDEVCPILVALAGSVADHVDADAYAGVQQFLERFAIRAELAVPDDDLVGVDSPADEVNGLLKVLVPACGMRRYHGFRAQGCCAHGVPRLQLQRPGLGIGPGVLSNDPRFHVRAVDSLRQIAHNGYANAIAATR